VPTTNLTERFLDRVKPDPEKQVDWWDKSLPGFGVRVAPGGARTFNVLYRLHGKLTRRSLGSLPPMRSSDLPRVWERARDILHEVKEGRDPFAPEPGTLTVEDLVERFLEESTHLRPTTRREWTRILHNRVLPKFGQRPATEVPWREWVAFLQDVAAHPLRAGYGRAESSANRIKTVCARVYAWGRDVGLFDVSPFAGRKALYHEQPEQRVLSNEELRAVLLACEAKPGDVGDLVQLLLLTCTRLSMVLGMRRAEVDADRLLWRVPPDRAGNKNAREHLVPLVKPALAIINRRLAEHEDEWVFPSTRDRHTPRPWSRPHKALAAFQARADATFRKLTRRSEPIPRWTLHNLRHTAATHLSEDLKVAPAIVTRLLAQTPPGAVVTRIYDRSELLDERRAALVAWASWLDRVKAGDAAPAKVLPHSRRARS
jgi:integrase